LADSEDELILKLLDDKSNVNRYVGTYRGLAGIKFLVDVGGSRIPCDSFSSYLPMINERVWVFFFDGAPFVMGPAVPRPAEGTIVSIGSGLAVVSTAIGNVQARYGSATGLAAGTAVKLVWANGAYILPIVTASVVAPTVPPAPGGEGGQKVAELKATDSGQFNTRWQNNAPRASDNVMGAWAYGGARLPAGSAPISGQIYLPRRSEAGVCRIGRHTSLAATLSGGWVGSLDEAPLSPRNGWVDVPLPILNGIVGVGGGITVTSGNGDNNWAGTQDDGFSGLLRIIYSI